MGAKVWNMFNVRGKTGKFSSLSLAGKGDGLGQGLAAETLKAGSAVGNTANLVGEG